MVFGINPKFVQQIPLADLSRNQFLVISIEVTFKLGWDIEYQSHINNNKPILVDSNKTTISKLKPYNKY